MNDPKVVDIWLAHPDLSVAEAAQVIGVPPSRAEFMVDVTHGSVGRLPTNLHMRIAGYTTGTPDIQWSGSDWTRFPKARLIRIDQSNDIGIHGDVKDVEPGASTVQTAVDAAATRAKRGASSTIYCDGSDLASVRAECEAKGLGIRIVAVQHAWASREPGTVIPGTKLTLGEVNADLSVVRPDWMPLAQPKPKPKPPAHVTIPVTAGGLATALVAVLTGAHVHVTPTEAAAIAAFIPSLVGLLKTFATTKRQ